MKGLPTIRRLLRRGALPLLAAVLAAACGDTGFGVQVPGGRAAGLRSGVYDYEAWTYGRRTAYWGFVELRVRGDGTLSGSYRLPRQCLDRFGFEADCVGHVGGRVYADGLVRFGFDEGWLRHEGEADRFGEVFGEWETRLLGASSAGQFELLPR
ncbi:MAG TPA: hypothetical protein VGR37_10100 [Longimicrobiaceae bacterium]|nr:hypothetical protein [Longimicrobiaceae bacterium]